MSKRTHMRLAAPYGRLIDRDKLIRFRFDGECYNGYAGDSIASALAANGVRILSRSFKYHRPRGILALAGNDANCLVQVGPEPNVRADARLIEAGLNVSAQNVAGNLGFDWGRAVEYLSRFLPVGFYYHAFFKPGRAWRFWEPVIRRMAGLGRVERSAEHDTIDHIHLFADVAVIGGGAAGMSAALAAAAHGARVIVLDDGAELGGALLLRSLRTRPRNPRAPPGRAAQSDCQRVAHHGLERRHLHGLVRRQLAGGDERHPVLQDSRTGRDCRDRRDRAAGGVSQ